MIAPRLMMTGALRVLGLYAVAVCGVALAPAAASEIGAEGQIIAPTADTPTRRALLEALHALGPDYEPRTEHLLEDGSPVYVNRLVTAASPYLLQHAHNPVDWYPWGVEAFAAAAERDVPVFLSIGYATCHWCHVMERESFENEGIAEFLNEHFVAIKVDREQHPDIDSLYMTAVQMMTGGGGWPMSSFLDTEGRSFFGGTYFPPDRFEDLLERVAYAWATQHDGLLADAEAIEQAITKANRLTDSVRAVGREEIGATRNLLVQNADTVNGGFGGAPKFPQESTLLFLLEQARRDAGEGALIVANDMLIAMAAGGIHDQIGGGFHRYTVDAEWRIPHFEKMLYNQAGLARAYALGHRLTADPDHAATTRGILDYVLREMTTDEGTFHSATDADSEGREGAYFVWTEEQLADVLVDPDEVAVAAALFGVDGIGNFETHKHPGETVLHRPAPLEELAVELEMPLETLERERVRLAERLRVARDSREAPLKDDKVLTGWNGLMITAFAEAGLALDEPRYLGAAERAADALWTTTWDAQRGELRRARYRGNTGIDARQTDYAWLAEAMLSLHDVDGGARWLARALQLSETMIDRFKDERDGGFYLGGPSVAGAALPTRPKDIDDASTPSGNGVALRVFARLFDRTGDARWNAEAEALVDALSGTLMARRGGMSSMLTGLMEHVDGERGPLLYAGRGNVRAVVRRDSPKTISVSLQLAEGWHLNAAEPLQDYLIGTALSGEAGRPLADVRYPDPVRRTLAFQSQELALLEHDSVITASAPPARADGLPPRVELRLQACSERICLAPETIQLEVPSGS